jgi:hypothetical protein
VVRGRHGDSFECAAELGRPQPATPQGPPEGGRDHLWTTGHLGLIYAATVGFVAGAVVALTGLLGRRAAG